MKTTENVPHYQSLASALVDIFGKKVAIINTDRVSGGDINKAYALTLNTGDKIFMKANAKDCASFFTAEAEGLNAIKSTKTIETPEIICTGTDDGEEVGYSFLLLRYLKSREPEEKFWETFAEQLANLHKADTSRFFEENSSGKSKGGEEVTAEGSDKSKTGHKFYGFPKDNFIGRTPQQNRMEPAAESDKTTGTDNSTETGKEAGSSTFNKTGQPFFSSWIDFFRQNRLEVQFKKAEKNFSEGELKKITKLLDSLEKIIVEPEKPSLLHGDLWRGNLMCTEQKGGKSQTPVLIDPAVYVGNREADIAMTELFGGFPEEFYQAYRASFPLEPGYEERRDLYNLYHLLNHLNLFGQSYLEPVLSIVDEYL